jgi:hypothetical protein
MFILRHHLPEKYGALKPLAPGTKHPDTIAREQAEAAGAAGEGAPDMLTEDQAAMIGRQLDQLLELYRRKLMEERQARLGGRIVEADYAVRQLTHLEVLLEIGGVANALIQYAEGERGPGEPDEPPIWRTPLTDELEAVRRRVWTETEDLARPPANVWTDQPSDGIYGGPDSFERERARADAERRMAEAQRDWEAAATSEAWGRRQPRSIPLVN